MLKVKGRGSRIRQRKPSEHSGSLTPVGGKGEGSWVDRASDCGVAQSRPPAHAACKRVPG